MRKYAFNITMISTLKVLSGLRVTKPQPHRAVRTMAARNKHCEKLTSRRIQTCGLWIESWAKSVFRNAYFLQPLFWRICVVAVLVTLKPDSTLNVEIWNTLAQWCSKTTKLQDQNQDHLISQDQDRSGLDQDQDHFFKTKTAFFKGHQIINPRPLA